MDEKKLKEAYDLMFKCDVKLEKIHKQIRKLQKEADALRAKRCEANDKVRQHHYEVTAPVLLEPLENTEPMEELVQPIKSLLQWSSKDEGTV